jgi:hypothetical protein
MTDDRAQQARKAAERPELLIISRGGQELAADALSITNFHSWGCNDYVLAEVDGDDVSVDGKSRCYVVLSPQDVVMVKPRDSKDHVAWLVARKRYEEALETVELIEKSGAFAEDEDNTINATEIGQKYIEHLVGEGLSVLV